MRDQATSVGRFFSWRIIVAAEEGWRAWFISYVYSALGEFTEFEEELEIIDKYWHVARNRQCRC
jgi:hypothetical protein